MIEKSLFDNFHRVALAVSGGKDSMTLLYDFARQFSHDFFYVINIEHGIRGEESVRDSEFVEDYARSLGVEVVRYNINAVEYSEEHGYTLEQGARLMRREIFARECAEGRCDRVVVAHHMDDNVESILMHIYRGSGLRGIRGMDEDDGTLLRPLLGVTRADIDAYVAEHDIPYREDSTNSDSSYRRNFIRHDIMPLLETRYPHVGESIMRLSRAAREDDDYLFHEAEVLVSEDACRMVVDTDASGVLVKRALYLAFTRLGVVADVEERHYDLLLGLRDKTNGTSLDMPYGVRATLEYGKIALYRPSDAPQYDTRCPLIVGNIRCGEYTMSVSEYVGDITMESEDGYRVLYVDADKVEGAMVRTRETGDLFTRYGGGTKRLKDYLIDKKIPVAKRNMPLITRGSDVLVVAGIEISNSVSVDASTQRVYKIKLRRDTI